LDFLGAARSLRMKYIPKNVGVHKSFASNYLEFHFGMEPLYHDIYDSCEVINNPVKSFTFEKSRASSPYKQSWSVDFGGVLEQDSASGQLRCIQGARIKAINSAGLHSLEQLGLANPAALAWEVVPFSFVVDWFVNVGDFLSSFTDFAGMTLDSTFSTTSYKIKSSTVVFAKTQPTAYRSTFDTSCVKTTRITSLSGINFEVKRLRPPSITRATTAISLLVGFLK
jgi:hypothetical protein